MSLWPGAPLPACQPPGPVVLNHLPGHLCAVAIYSCGICVTDSSQVSKSSSGAADSRDDWGRALRTTGTVATLWCGEEYMTRVWWNQNKGGNIRTWGGGPSGRRKVIDACVSLGNQPTLCHVGGQLSGPW
jgi:hypothetical protein